MSDTNGDPHPSTTPTATNPPKFTMVTESAISTPTNPPPGLDPQPAEDASVSDSPVITSISWGRIIIPSLDPAELKDAKLWPGGGRAWDWNETGTRHNPGIQMSDIEELLEHGAEVIVLSRGMDERLGVSEDVVEEVKRRGVQVYVVETREAVRLYGEEVKRGRKVGALVHSTC
jgi:hypothetical protein